MQQARLLRLAKSLAWLGLAWHVGEAAIGFYLGYRLDSAALKGFALDSGVEILAGLFLLMRFASRGISERAAGRLIGFSFVLIAAWITGEALVSFWSPASPASSGEQLAGVLFAGMVIVSMYPLAIWKHRVARRLHSDAALSEGRQTMLCAHMGWILLLGVLGPMVSMPFLDGVAALLIALLALFEGYRAFQGKECSCSLHVGGVDYAYLNTLSARWSDSLSPAGKRMFELRLPLSVAFVAFATWGVFSAAPVLIVGLCLLGMAGLWLPLYVLRRRIEIGLLSALRLDSQVGTQEAS